VPQFARRHYIVLARALRQAFKKAATPREKRGILHAHDAICEAMLADNENFNQRTFEEAALREEVS